MLILQWRNRSKVVCLVDFMTKSLTCNGRIVIDVEHKESDRMIHVSKV